VDRRRESLPTRVDGLPPLAPEYHAALDAGLAALAISLTATARASIDDHARLLLAWNRAINLTAITDPARVALLHVVDSLTALAVVGVRRGSARLLDLGSGGGYPAIPLAAASAHVEATLVESIGKKARFLGAAVDVANLGSRVAVVAARAETLATPIRRGELEPFDVVTARAVGPLSDLVRLALPLLGPGGRLIAWKRGDLSAEIRGATQAALPLGGARITIRSTAVPGLEGHVLVVVEKPAPRGPRGPRAPRSPRDPHQRMAPRVPGTRC
jgi:16S rRNA (guanine527-N7)-methyltransferase